MSPKDYKEKMRPLIITIIVCVVFLIFVNIWSQKQIKVIEEARPVIKEEPKERAITPTERVKELEKEEMAETAEPQADKVEELVNAQYQAYSKESKEQKASPTSKYSIHPSEEELQRIKENKHLMQ